MIGASSSGPKSAFAPPRQDDARHSRTPAIYHGTRKARVADFTFTARRCDAATQGAMQGRRHGNDNIATRFLFLGDGLACAGAAGER